MPHPRRMTRRDALAVGAKTAVGAAARPVLLAVEGDAPVAAAPRADDEAGFIYELQRG